MVTFRVIPSPDTATVAVLESVEVFSLLAVTVTVPLLDPFDGEQFSQDALSLTDQLVLEVTLKLPLLPEEEPRFNVLSDTVRFVSTISINFNFESP